MHFNDGMPHSEEREHTVVTCSSTNPSDKRNVSERSQTADAVCVVPFPGGWHWVELVHGREAGKQRVLAGRRGEGGKGAGGEQGEEEEE